MFIDRRIGLSTKIIEYSSVDVPGYISRDARLSRRLVYLTRAAAYLVNLVLDSLAVNIRKVGAYSDILPRSLRSVIDLDKRE